LYWINSCGDGFQGQSPVKQVLAKREMASCLSAVMAIELDCAGTPLKYGGARLRIGCAAGRFQAWLGFQGFPSAGHACIDLPETILLKIARPSNAI
jgi:hypothetical protein